MSERTMFLKKVRKLVVNKDLLELKDGFTIWLDCDRKKFMQSHLIRADRIEYISNKQGEFFDHHLMFYFKEILIFKVWLPNKGKNKPFKNIVEALNKSGFWLPDLDKE